VINEKDVYAGIFYFNNTSLKIL